MSLSLAIGCPKHTEVLEYRDPQQLDLSEGYAMGGCNHMCHIEGEPPLPCGHFCPLKCHGNDHSADSGFRCQQPCSRSCPKGHPCQYACNECERLSPEGSDCLPCKVEIEHVYPCGHKSTMLCGDSQAAPPCPFPCGKVMECGHICQLQCGHEGTCISTYECPVEVRVTCTACNKVHVGPCHTERTHGPEGTCPHPCVARLPCGHMCTGVCGTCHKDGHQECVVEVQYKHPDCGHTQTMPCGESQADPECTAVCGKDKGCGHTCTKPCGHRGPCAPPGHECFEAVEVKCSRCGGDFSSTCTNVS
ncbi:hypothetical protein KIPB_009342, partial [Kipferlia bialata]|eukprot:g9342.t1